MFDSIIILGPTATGKTNLSIELAQSLNSEIVNADSMYIYKYFDIGTAKPTHLELSKVKHHLIGFLEPNEDYSVSDYREDAKKIISQMKLENKIPIIVGGTGFYIDSLIKSLTYGGVEKDNKFRAKLTQELNEFGKEFLYEKLKQKNPSMCEKIHINDTKRIIRALEICEYAQSDISNDYDIILSNPLIIGLNMDRGILYERINKRVDIMIKDGLIDEVRNLYNRGFTPENSNAMKGIGYKEIIDYLNGNCSIDEAIDKIKQHTRNYAKRQITWFKRNEKIVWLDALSDNLCEQVLKLYK